MLNWNHCSCTNSVWNELRPIFDAFLTLIFPQLLHNICRKSAVELPGKYLLENQTDPWNTVHKVRWRSQIEKFNNKDFVFKNIGLMMLTIECYLWGFIGHSLLSDYLFSRYNLNKNLNNNTSNRMLKTTTMMMMIGFVMLSDRAISACPAWHYVC